MANPSETFRRLPRCGEDSVLTYSGVVKRWECDRNDHWNVQFYVRAFQMASEVLAAALTGSNPGAVSASMRHYRFHGELFCPDPMRIRSSRIQGGAHNGMVVHWMETGPEGRLVATAIETPAYPTEALPPRAAETLAPALPRGIGAGGHRADDPLPEGDGLHRAQLGVVRPADVDHRQDLSADETVARTGAASQHMLGCAGFTADWVDKANRNRMAVEMKITRHGSCGPGESLAALSWITAAPGAKTFATTHRLVNAGTGASCATVEQLMMVVDLTTRRPVALPDFLIAARSAAGPDGGTRP